MPTTMLYFKFLRGEQKQKFLKSIEVRKWRSKEFCSQNQMEEKAWGSQQM